MWNEFCRGVLGFGRFNWMGGVYMLIGLILIVVVLYFAFNKKGVNISSSNNAEEILKERLAKGEIGEEEYDNLSKKLNYK